MSLITENKLREELKNSDTAEYIAEKGAIVTPSAKQYLTEKNIKLIYKEDKKNNTENDERINEKKSLKYKYIHINGGAFEEKPEHMTQLNGNKLVNKDNKRIILRGKLDSLQAKILEVQMQSKAQKEMKIVEELEEILSFVRKILGCEVLETDFNIDTLIGLNMDELRAYSHNPKKYLYTEHIIYPSIEMGNMVILLNALRALSREAELSAYQAFKNDDGESARKDISLSLNRLSSCFYIMMLKCKAGKYK